MIAKVLKIAGNILALMILLSAITIIFLKVKEAEYYPIAVVKVYGIQHVDQHHVENLMTPFVKKGFFAINVELIKDQLAQLPWVSQSVVRRIWPNQVTVIVHEKSALARWNDTSLLSTSGELFSPAVGTYPDGLPQFIGPIGEQIVMAKYYAKMSSLLVPLHFKIVRLELTSTLEWALTLDNGIKLNIGRKDILTRISHFVKVYPQIVGDQQLAGVEYIDLRYPNGMAVRWKSVT
jgi:cell division protein FtsQ